MKLKRLFLLLIFLSTTIAVGFTQDLESKLQQLINKNKIDELRAKIELIKRKYPNSAIVNYVEAFIEKDGEIAVKKYKNFIRRFPQSPYAVNAQYKLAQFYFAKGLYRSSKQMLNDIINSFPNSHLADDAYYLMIRCLIALEYTKEAKDEFKKFSKKYSKSPVKKLAEYDLEQVKKMDYRKSKDQDFKSVNAEYRNYAIQVGAYLDKENAIKQMNVVSKWGYPVQISTKYVNRNLFYLVWIGNFETEQQALSFGEIFKKKYGLPFRVVKKENAL